MILLIRGTAVGVDINGSEAFKEYEPFRELKGETWKSLVHVFENVDEGVPSSSARSLSVAVGPRSRK